MRRQLLTVRAVTLLRRSEPLPLDLFAALLEEGVDVARLERRYGA